MFLKISRAAVCKNIIRHSIIFLIFLSFWKYLVLHLLTVNVFLPNKQISSSYPDVYIFPSLSPSSPHSLTLSLLLLTNSHKLTISKTQTNFSFILSFFPDTSLLPFPPPSLPCPFSHKHKTILSYPALAWENHKKNDECLRKEPKKRCETESGAEVEKGESGQEGRRVRARGWETQHEERKRGSRCFWTKHMNWVRCIKTERRGKKEK